MSTRKEKADKKKAERQKAVIKPQASTVNATPDTETPDPLVSLRHRPLNSIEAVQGEAVVPNPTVPQMTRRGDALTRVTPVQGQAVAMNQEQAGAPVNPATKPITLSDMLAEQRQNAIKDKTDAVKMQKYYALTDALGALGKMGGAAVGGAIGGNMLDSAPAVGEYQPSRGYVDAFERAQKANDRLRALDDRNFQLAYSKQQRDEERAYAEKKTKEDRAYQAEQNKIAREFQAEQARLTREWNKAVADNDFTRQAELKKEILDLQNRYAAADDKRSREYLQLQHDLYNTKHPIMFSDGSVMNLSTQELEDMLENYKGQTVGGVKINKDNFGEVLRKNPQAFAEYFKMIGASTVGSGPNVAKPSTTITQVDTSFPQHISQIPLENLSSPKPVVERTTSSEETDLTKKWESSEI